MEPERAVSVESICNPYDIKFNNGYYLSISYIICVSSRLLIGLVFTAIIFLDSKISNINNFYYQHSIVLLNTRRQNKHLNDYHLLVANAVGIFDIKYQNLISDTNMDDVLESGGWRTHSTCPVTARCRSLPGVT